MSWVDKAACKGTEDPLFVENQHKAILKYCLTCPVMDECLESALSFGMHAQYGAQGGKTDSQRILILRKRSRVQGDLAQ